MKKPIEAIKSVILWMNNQMYYEHTKWTHGNENAVKYLLAAAQAQGVVLELPEVKLLEEERL